MDRRTQDSGVLIAVLAAFAFFAYMLLFSNSFEKNWGSFWSTVNELGTKALTGTSGTVIIFGAFILFFVLVAAALFFIAEHVYHWAWRVYYVRWGDGEKIKRRPD